MKKVFKKLSTIAMMTFVMLSVFAFKPSLSSNNSNSSGNIITVFAVDEEAPVDDKKEEKPTGGDGDTGSTEGDTAFTKIVNFFATWLKRVGYLVAFVGGIMFALAIKNNDAEQKQNGLLTLVAGFVVVALCAAKNLFNL